MIQNTKIKRSSIKRSSIKLIQPPEYTHAKINPSILSRNNRLSAKLAAAPRVSILSNGLYKQSPSCSPDPPHPNILNGRPHDADTDGDDSMSADSDDEEETEIEMNAATTMCSVASAKSGSIWINPIYTANAPSKTAPPEVSNGLSMRSSIGFSTSNSLALSTPLPSQTVLLPQFTENDRECIFAANGYADAEKVTDTLQGVESRSPCLYSLYIFL